jgi:catabolite regulation protein CreA
MTVLQNGEYVGATGAVELSLTESGHYLAEFVGTVTTEGDTRQLATMTVHGVDDESVASLTCVSESNYRAPEAAE